MCRSARRHLRVGLEYSGPQAREAPLSRMLKFTIGQWKEHTNASIAADVGGGRGDVDFEVDVVRFEDGYTRPGGFAGNKGRRVRSVPMSANVRRVLWPLSGQGRRGARLRARGQTGRADLRQRPLPAVHQRQQARGPAAARFHDLRHTSARRRSARSRSTRSSG